jgi:hypothetical protein
MRCTTTGSSFAVMTDVLTANPERVAPQSTHWRSRDDTLTRLRQVPSHWLSDPEDFSVFRQPLKTMRTKAFKALTGTRREVPHPGTTGVKRERC